MALRLGSWWLLAITSVIAQDSISDDRTTRTDSTLTLSEATTPTSLYQSFASQITQETDGLVTVSDGTTYTLTDNTTDSATAKPKTSDTVTILTGSAKTTATTLSGNVSTTVSPTPGPQNTQVCNNYLEFCTRKYSNITEVACHNSPFITQNNIAANQQYDVTQQLDDGVRFLQAQIQWPGNATEPHFCHTSCEILDAGPITDWLTTVKDWVAQHPFDVVTILLGNGNYSAPSLYVPYIEKSGIRRYVYTPPYVPMNLTSWPTLAEMILSGERVVMFLDYEADQKEYPWLLDQFSQMWETPFDPVDNSFPCDVQRPPDLSVADANNRLNLVNHNLNIQLSVLGADVLVPARGELNTTNNATGPGSLGHAADNCLAQWGRPPNFLNVDYYNYGGYPGSVFEVAARMNNVTYNRPCCGVPANGGIKGLSGPKPGATYLFMALTLFSFLT
ncbi:putative tat pathway signal sequence [Rosellinia necatrix]|uniref:Putative tat pathway signal sequence n=1 Tax=Rosellinia necatrix TaxID=77044 RepID=A0A1W2TW16_ROSNE|nr:putative tat pathway signal sequence [Rosellinia necatrix]